MRRPPALGPPPARDYARPRPPSAPSRRRTMRPRSGGRPGAPGRRRRRLRCRPRGRRLPPPPPLPLLLGLLLAAAGPGTARAKETAFVEVVLFESSPSGDYTTYTTGLTGRFSRAGATLSAEGEIVQVAARRPGPAPLPPQDGSGGCARRPRRGLAGGRAGGAVRRPAASLSSGRAGGRDAASRAPPWGGERTWGSASRGSQEREGRPRVRAPTLRQPPQAVGALAFTSGGSPGNYLLSANFGETSDEGWGGSFQVAGCALPPVQVL